MRLAVLALVTLAAASLPLHAENALLRYPTISPDAVVFAYGGDLWRVPRTGGEALRLTSHPGWEALPRFSPDGRSIAFSAEYDGSADVYVMPAAGGVPLRLTFHPNADRVVGWTPDGSRILFRSARASAPQAFDQLYTIAPTGGFEQRLPLPTSGFASFSPDATRIAYNRTSIESRTWKRYRGGLHAYVSLYDLRTNAYDELPHSDASDIFPMWSGRAIYFASDRDGIMNLYRYDLDAKTTRQLTSYRDYDVKWPSLGGGDKPAIVYEHGGELFALDLASEQSAAIPVTIRGDFPALRPAVVGVDKWLNTFRLSPSGARAVIEARGEIFTVPASQGDTRNLTNTSGVRELDPAWSPDGRSIAWFSDATGEYELYVAPQDGRAPARRLTGFGSGFRFGPLWSADSKRIAFADRAHRLYWIDVAANAQPVLVDESPHDVIASYDWSPDGRWLAYAKTEANRFRRIWLYSVEQRRAFAVTSGVTDDFSPVFDRSGDFLYFLSNRNFAPTFSDFEQTFTFQQSTGIFAALLTAGATSPFAPQSDEENAPAAQKGGASLLAATPPPRLEIVEVPVAAGTYKRIAAAKHNLFYLAVPPGGGKPNRNALHLYDVDGREDTQLMTGIADYEITPAGDKVMYRAGDTLGIVAAKPAKAGEGKLDTASMQMTLNRRAEWRQIFDEAWRMERDFFYDPTMAGLDWPAVKRRYERMLPYVAHRNDLTYVIGEMISELSVSFSTSAAATRPPRPASRSAFSAPTSTRPATSIASRRSTPAATSTRPRAGRSRRPDCRSPRATTSSPSTEKR